MADYGNSTDLGYLLTPITNDVSASLKSYGLEVATTWVNSKITGVSTSSVPDLVEKAATYYAYVFILKNLYDTTGEEAPNIDWYEKQANDLLSSYIESVADEESTIHPYSGSLSPTYQYMGRNKRTTDDDTDYDDVDDTTWESEG